MSAASDSPAYRVLARKYRPSSFADLVGQEALVRTLTNAFESGRIAHAFMLTGVRGVGKTTTARIIAKALNHVGPDGKGGPTINPSPDCPVCQAIGEGRHPDVIEMDAASNNSVDNIREIIAGARYAPSSARYKVYIIDEVHMLSNAAFNALLKTLEEPPEHVKFIFATTEIRKVPVTVLSRCQRFDLRRIPADTLSGLFADICIKEKVEIEPEALSMVARAADGSARDGLSILDRAIALSGVSVTTAQVADMLGLADRAAVFDLTDCVMKGATRDAIAQARGLYDKGADPVVVVQDLLDATYWLTRLKVSPDLASAPGTPEIERTKGKEMADALSMAVLTRLWQMLLKGLGEVQQAPQPIQALEMLLVRLCHAADLPTPGDLVKQIQDAGGVSAGGGSGGGGGMGRPGPSAPSGHGGGAPMLRAVAGERPMALPMGDAVASLPSAQPEVPPGPPPVEPPAQFEALVALFEERRDGKIAFQLRHAVRLVRYEPGSSMLEFNTTENADRNLAQMLGERLKALTGRRWMVGISSASGEPTLAERARQEEVARFDAASRDPMVLAVREAFPGAKLKAVVPRREPEPVAPMLAPVETADGDIAFDPDMLGDEDQDELLF